MGEFFYNWYPLYASILIVGSLILVLVKGGKDG